MTRITAGQKYSLAVVVVIVALLAPSLSNWHAARDVRPLQFAYPPPSAPGTAPPAAGGGPALGSPLGGLGALPGVAGSGGLTPGGADLRFPSLRLGGHVALPPTGKGPSSVSSTSTCPPIDAATAKLLTGLNKSLGIIPTQTVITALELATGCSSPNPALFAVGALQEVGDDLTKVFTEIGLAGLKLPAIHAVKLPAPLLTLFKPAAPALAPVCGAVGTASDVVILVAPHYPGAISGATSLALFQLAATCAQLVGNG